MNIIRKYWSILFFAILFLLIGWYVSDYFSKSEVDKLRTDLKKVTLKNDSLVMIKKNLYTKMVADTSKIKDLKRKVKSLELYIKEPQIVIEKKVVFDTIQTEVESTITENRNINFEDYYPTKENPFIKYSAIINTQTKKVNGEFLLQPLSLFSTIGLNDKGEYRINSRVPNFANISSLSAISEPYKEQQKKDVFGFIFGAGYGKSFKTEVDFLQFQTGFRINKTYLFLNAGTNQTVGATLMVEF